MLRTNLFASVVLFSLCCPTTQTYCMEDFLENINNFIVAQIPSSPYIMLILAGVSLISISLNILQNIREKNIDKLYSNDLRSYTKYRAAIINWNKKNPDNQIEVNVDQLSEKFIN